MITKLMGSMENRHENGVNYIFIYLLKGDEV